MVIDLDIKAEELGVSFDDYAEADEKMSLWHGTPENDGSIDAYLNAVKRLPKRELVALIRWNDLHKRFPDHFCWDGLVERADDEA